MHHDHAVYILLEELFWLKLVLLQEARVALKTVRELTSLIHKEWGVLLSFLLFKIGQFLPYCKKS